MQQKWGIFSRLWHWSNMLVIFALIVTSWFLETEIGPQIKRYHIYIGYGLIALLILRLIYNLMGKDSKNTERNKKTIVKARKLLREKGLMKMNPREKYEFKKAGAKLSYLGFFVCLLGIIVSGLVLTFSVALGLESTKAFQEIHEICNYLILAFIGLHLVGIIAGECTYEPNIVSEMIHGGGE